MYNRAKVLEYALATSDAIVVTLSLEVPLFFTNYSSKLARYLCLWIELIYKIYKAENFALKTILRYKWINQNYFITQEYLE